MRLLVAEGNLGRVKLYALPEKGDGFAFCTEEGARAAREVLRRCKVLRSCSRGGVKMKVVEAPDSVMEELEEALRRAKARRPRAAGSSRRSRTPP